MNMYWEFENGNKFSKEKYSYERAEELSKTLIDCRNCVNCEYCSYCSYCDDCEECIHCSNCEECEKCVECSWCAYCYGLEDEHEVNDS